jgi:hypothetical protein
LKLEGAASHLGRLDGRILGDSPENGTVADMSCSQRQSEEEEA